MSSVGFASVAFLTFAGIELQVDAHPDPCDLAHELEASLRRLSREEVESPIPLEVHVRANATSVELRVRDEARARWMTRKFALRAKACEATADAIAYMVARLRRNLGNAAPGVPTPVPADTESLAHTTAAPGEWVASAVSAGGSDGADDEVPHLSVSPPSRRKSLNRFRTEPLGLRRLTRGTLPPRRVSIRSPALRASRFRTATSTANVRPVQNVSLSADVHMVMEAPSGHVGVTGGLGVAWDARSRLGVAVSVFPQSEEAVRRFAGGPETAVDVSSVRVMARLDRCAMLWSVGLCAGARLGAERFETAANRVKESGTLSDNAVSPIIGLNAAVEVGRIFSFSGQVSGNLLIRPNRPALAVGDEVDREVFYRPPSFGGSISLGLVLDFGA